VSVVLSGNTTTVMALIDAFRAVRPDSHATTPDPIDENMAEMGGFAK
jgi:hypothetical protein